MSDITDFNQKRGIHTSVDLSGLNDEVRVSPEIESLLFRSLFKVLGINDKNQEEIIKNSKPAHDFIINAGKAIVTHEPFDGESKQAIEMRKKNFKLQDMNGGFKEFEAWMRLYDESKLLEWEGKSYVKWDKLISFYVEISNWESVYEEVLRDYEKHKSQQGSIVESSEVKEPSQPTEDGHPAQVVEDAVASTITPTVENPQEVESTGTADNTVETKVIEQEVVAEATPEDVNTESQTEPVEEVVDDRIRAEVIPTPVSTSEPIAVENKVEEKMEVSEATVTTTGRSFEAEVPRVEPTTAPTVTTGIDNVSRATGSFVDNTTNSNINLFKSKEDIKMDNTNPMQNLNNLVQGATSAMAGGLNLDGGNVPGTVGGSRSNVQEEGDATFKAAVNAAQATLNDKSTTRNSYANNHHVTAIIAPSEAPINRRKSVDVVLEPAAGGKPAKMGQQFVTKGKLYNPAKANTLEKKVEAIRALANRFAMICTGNSSMTWDTFVTKGDGEKYRAYYTLQNETVTPEKAADATKRQNAIWQKIQVIESILAQAVQDCEYEAEIRVLDPTYPTKGIVIKDDATNMISCYIANDAAKKIGTEGLGWVFAENDVQLKDGSTDKPTFKAVVATPKTSAASSRNNKKPKAVSVKKKIQAVSTKTDKYSNVLRITRKKEFINANPEQNLKFLFGVNKAKLGWQQFKAGIIVGTGDVDTASFQVVSFGSTSAGVYDPIKVENTDAQAMSVATNGEVVQETKYKRASFSLPVYAEVYAVDTTKNLSDEYKQAALKAMPDELKKGSVDESQLRKWWGVGRSGGSLATDKQAQAEELAARIYEERKVMGPEEFGKMYPEWDKYFLAATPEVKGAGAGSAFTPATPAPAPAPQQIGAAQPVITQPGTQPGNGMPVSYATQQPGAVPGAANPAAGNFGGQPIPGFDGQ